MLVLIVILHGVAIDGTHRLDVKVNIYLVVRVGVSQFMANKLLPCRPIKIHTSDKSIKSRLWLNVFLFHIYPYNIG